MGKAYENYATAQRVHSAHHNAYMATLRAAGLRGKSLLSASRADTLPSHIENKAITKARRSAAKAAMYLADAKAQYHAAKTASIVAGEAA